MKYSFVMSFVMYLINMFKFDYKILLFALQVDQQILLFALQADQ